MTSALSFSLRAFLSGVPERFRLLGRAVRLAIDAAPAATVGWGALLVVQGLLPAAAVYLTKLVVDSLLAAVAAQGAWAAAHPVVLYGGLLGGVLLAQQVAGGVLQWVRLVQSERVGDHLRALVQRKATEVDYAVYETPEYFDRLSRVTGEASARPLALIETLGGVMQSALTLLAMAALLVPYGWWVPAALFGSVLPALVVHVRHGRRYHAWWERRTEDRRRAQYADTLLAHPMTAAEVRLFGLGPRFREAYAQCRAVLRGERLSLERRQVAGRVGAGLFALFGVGGVMVWMGTRVVQGALTVGDLALFYQAFQRGQGLARGLLTGAGQVYENALFLEHLFGFLDQEPAVSSPPSPHPVGERIEGGIRFEGVTFRYPGAERPVLEDFDLFIPAGQTVALVGENGAGKSTVLKLVARFYDVEAGAVTVDDVDVRAVDLEAHWRRTTALFQLPVSYYVPVAEAIAMSDPEGGQDPARIEAAARAAGIHERILRLPKGYATQLGKWFTDGQELSGGEWQRLAMARAFYRDAPIILLDEPTSMMDAWSEAAWFDRFRGLAAGRTAVLITHRFTIARRADLIYVMRGGEVVEAGSHEELLALGGWYRESWEEQVASTPPTPVEGPPDVGEPLAEPLGEEPVLAAEGSAVGAVAGSVPRLGGRP